MKDTLHNRQHHVTRELGTPNKPKIAVGLGKDGLVPAYTLDDDPKPRGKDTVQIQKVTHIQNPADFHEYPIPDSFIMEIIKWFRRK